MAGDLAAILHLDDVVLVFRADAGDALEKELRTEAVRLQEGPLGEFVAAEAGGEAEIVFDLRAGACLSAGRVGLDDQRAQALGGSIDACGESCRTGPDDDHVVELLLGLGAQAHLVGQFRDAGLHQGSAIAEEDDRELGVVDAFFLEQGMSVRVLLRVQPLVGNSIARKEVAHLVVHRRPAHADDANAFEGWLVALLPGFEQVVQHRVELFFGRIPRLVQVVVDLGGVDGADGGFGVGVGGQQHALGVRIDGRAPAGGSRRLSCPACAGRRGRGRRSPCVPSAGGRYPERRPPEAARTMR